MRASPVIIAILASSIATAALPTKLPSSSTRNGRARRVSPRISSPWLIASNHYAKCILKSDYRDKNSEDCLAEANKIEQEMLQQPNKQDALTLNSIGFHQCLSAATSDIESRICLKMNSSHLDSIYLVPIEKWPDSQKHPFTENGDWTGILVGEDNAEKITWCRLNLFKDMNEANRGASCRSLVAYSQASPGGRAVNDLQSDIDARVDILKGR